MAATKQKKTTKRKKKAGAPSVMGFLSRVGGSPQVGNTPTKGLLGEISREDLKLAGRLVQDDGIDADDIEISTPGQPVRGADDAPTLVEQQAGPSAPNNDVKAVESWLGDGSTVIESQQKKPPGATVEAQLSEPQERWGELEDLMVEDAKGVSRLKLARQIGRGRRGDRDDRGAERIPASLRVEYRNAGRVEVELAADISQGGAFVRTAAPLDVGDPILLTFDLPEQRFPLQLAARVKWVSPFGDARSAKPGMGVQFTAISERKRAQLESLIRAASDHDK